MSSRKPTRLELVSALSGLLDTHDSLVHGAFSGTCLVPGKLAAQDHVRALLQSENSGVHPKLRIVCAANRTTRDGGVIFLGARHFDALMRTAIDAYFLGEQVDLEEGFIDQFGDFHSRVEAWKIAEAADQILHRCGGDDTDGGTLYSENLY